MSFVFRKSMFGFNKDDVLACVNELLDKTAAISGELESERKEIIIDGLQLIITDCHEYDVFKKIAKLNYIEDPIFIFRYCSGNCLIISPNDKLYQHIFFTEENGNHSIFFS